MCGGASAHRPHSARCKAGDGGGACTQHGIFGDLENAGAESAVVGERARVRVLVVPAARAFVGVRASWLQQGAHARGLCNKDRPGPFSSPIVQPGSS